MKALGGAAAQNRGDRPAEGGGDNSAAAYSVGNENSPSAPIFTSFNAQNHRPRGGNGAPYGGDGGFGSVNGTGGYNAGAQSAKGGNGGLGGNGTGGYNAGAQSAKGGNSGFGSVNGAGGVKDKADSQIADGAERANVLASLIERHEKISARINRKR